jgi:methyl-accepting chemotaxis protein
MEKRLDDLEKQYHTLEQRVTNIEHLEREGNFTLRDVAHKATIILGNVTVINEELQEFKTSTNQRLSNVERKMEDVDGRLSILEDKFDQVHKSVEENSDLLRQILAKLQ